MSSVASSAWSRYREAREVLLGNKREDVTGAFRYEHTAYFPIAIIQASRLYRERNPTPTAWKFQRLLGSGGEGSASLLLHTDDAGTIDDRLVVKVANPYHKNDDGVVEIRPWDVMESEVNIYKRTETLDNDYILRMYGARIVAGEDPRQGEVPERGMRELATDAQRLAERSASLQEFHDEVAQSTSSGSSDHTSSQLPDLPGLNWMYLEYCPYGSLAQFISSVAANQTRVGLTPENWGTLPLQVLWYIFKALVTAMLALEGGNPMGQDQHPVDLSWSNEIVHLDLKPLNVLLNDAETTEPIGGRFPRPNVADFGCAVETNILDADNPDEYSNRGTTFYNAPEFFESVRHRQREEQERQYQEAARQRTRGQRRARSGEQDNQDTQQGGAASHESASAPSQASDRPQVHYGSPTKMLAHTNVFQVGLIMWCLLTLQEPSSAILSAGRWRYDRDGFPTTMPYNPSILQQEYSDEMRELIQLIIQCMARNPIARPGLDFLYRQIQSKLDRPGWSIPDDFPSDDYFPDLFPLGSRRPRLAETRPRTAQLQEQGVPSTVPFSAGRIMEEQLRAEAEAGAHPDAQATHGRVSAPQSSGMIAQHGSAEPEEGQGASGRHSRPSTHERRSQGEPAEVAEVQEGTIGHVEEENVEERRADDLDEGNEGRAEDDEGQAETNEGQAEGNEGPAAGNEGQEEGNEGQEEGNEEQGEEGEPSGAAAEAEEEPEAPEAPPLRRSSRIRNRPPAAVQPAQPVQQPRAGRKRKRAQAVAQPRRRRRRAAAQEPEQEEQQQEEEEQEQEQGQEEEGDADEPRRAKRPRRRRR